jgi:hypothetical protein
MLAAILTFAILFDLRLVLAERSDLGENHRKLAIPAGYVGCGDKREGGDEGGRPAYIANWVSLVFANPGCAACCCRDSFCVAISQDLLRELV